MPKANKIGVRGLSREASGRWCIDIRWTDRKTGRAMRHIERLPATVKVSAAKTRAREAAVNYAAPKKKAPVKKTKK